MHAKRWTGQSSCPNNYQIFKIWHPISRKWQLQIFFFFLRVSLHVLSQTCWRLTRLQVDSQSQLVFSRYILCWGDGKGLAVRVLSHPYIQIGLVGLKYAGLSWHASFYSKHHQCLKHTRLPWRSEIQGLLYVKKDLGFPESPNIIQRHLWDPCLGLPRQWWRHQCHDYLRCKRVSRLAENAQRSLRDLIFIGFSYHCRVWAYQTSQ